MYTVNNPIGKIYEDLIKLSFEICDEFILVKIPDRILTNKEKEVFEALKPSLLRTKEQSEWPGTIWGNANLAKVNYYKTDIYARDIILKVSDSLFSWHLPDLPEDLCFLKNGQNWLINTAHEGICDFCVENMSEDEIDRIKRIKGLNLEF